MRSTVTVWKGGTYLRITDYKAPFVQDVIMPFCRRRLYRLGQVPIPGTRQKRTVVTHSFARLNNDRSEFRISAGLLDDFIQFMEGVGYKQSRVKIEDEPVIKGKDVEFKWKEGWGAPRPHQEDWCEYQLADGPVKVNNAQTGDGKTFMATHTMVNTNKRTLITCLPRYVSIWFESLGQSVELEPEDIMLVGNGKIEEAAETIKEGKADPKIIILPLTRYDTYLKREREEDIPCLDDVFSDMEIGLRIMDEAHEDIYRVYMSMLFGNFEKTIALSATLKADDPFVNDIYRYVYPPAMRLKEPEYKKFIDVVAYHHYIDMQKYRINTKGFGGYSHVKYEQAILKSPKLYSQYLDLCKQAFEEFYVNDHKEGQKCLWFFSTVEMATRMKEDFEEAYPDMDIWKFTNTESKNKETEMSYMEHQVVFTTPQSCGTGKDIPDLAVAFSPYACSSRQRNDQMLGRTRPLKNYPGDSPKFVYFVCSSIPKQKEYHQKRKQLFAVKSKSHRNINSFHHIT